jgi:hypothetical protein
MTCVIQIVGLASGKPSNAAGKYLRAFDPDAHGGRGHVLWTADRSKAMRFANTAEALAIWRRPSTKYPLRPDGKPNRPHAAYEIAIVPLDGSE